MRTKRDTLASNRWAASSVYVLFSLGLVGCTDSGGASKKSTSFSTSDGWQHIDSAMLQRDLMSFTDRFCSAMSDAYDRLAESAKTSHLRNLAQDSKALNALGVLTNAVDDNAIVGFMDTLIVVRLIRQSSEDPWFTEAFGEDAAKASTVLKAQEQDIWKMAARYFTPKQLAELVESTDRWRREHPDQRYVAMVRLSDFSEARVGSSAGGAKGLSSVFGLQFLDPMSGLDPAVREVERSRETVERVFFYLQRMPMLLSWQAESSYRKMLSAPEVQQVVESTAKFSASTTRFTDSTHSVADSIARFPAFVTEERRRTVDQLSQKLTEQRDAAVRQVAASAAIEREALIRQVAASAANEREALIRQATTQISTERELAINQFQSAIQRQRQGLVSDAESATRRSIDHFFWLGTLVVVTAIVVTTVAASIYRGAFARSSRSEESAHTLSK
jgi:hypothetical protein